MSTLAFSIKLSNQYIEDHAVATGVIMASPIILELDLGPLTPEDRRLAMEIHKFYDSWVVDSDNPLPALPATQDEILATVYYLDELRRLRDQYEHEKAQKAFEKMLDELEALSEDELGKIQGYDRFHFPRKLFTQDRLMCEAEKIQAEDSPRVQALLERMKVPEIPFKAEEKRLEIKQREAEAEKEHLAKEQKEARLAERATWVATHGSDYLKKAIGAEYDCAKQYVTERAALELGTGFKVDFGKTINWDRRSCPSEQALDLALELQGKGFNAEVVWLKDYEGETPLETREAVAVRNYLGKYNVVH